MAQKDPCVEKHLARKQSLAWRFVFFSFAPSNERQRMQGGGLQGVGFLLF